MSKAKSSLRTPLGLGDRIRVAREAKGWTQSDLGSAVRVSRSAVSQWEKGSVQNLKLGNLFAVAEVLGKNVRDLVFGDGTGDAVADDHRARWIDPPAQQTAFLRAYDSLPKEVRQHLRNLVIALATSTAESD